MDRPNSRSIERVKTWSTLAITALLLAKVVGNFTFLRLPRHPNDFEPRRYTLVASLMYQEETSEGDIDESEGPAVWSDPASGTFYTLFDRWRTQRVLLQNWILRISSWAVGSLVVGVVIARRLLLTRFGVEFAQSVNPPLPWFFAGKPIVRYSLLAVAVMVGVVGALDLIMQGRRGRETGVSVSVVDDELYRRFYYGHRDQAERWGLDIAGAPHVIKDLPIPGADE
jgi:hypothetical protein